MSATEGTKTVAGESSGDVDASAAMRPSFEEATLQVTATGGRFELTEIDVDGRLTPAFANAPDNLRELFDSARRHSEKTFIVYEGERLTFDDVMERVDALAAAMVERYGVTPGDRVGIAMRNLPEWVISFAAITSIGAISVSFNAWWVSEEIEYALDDCEPVLLLVDPERAERSREAAAARSVPVVVARADRHAPLAQGLVHWADVVRPGATMPEVELRGEDDATILYTSGTTGHPKGAVSSHRAVCQALFGFACRGAVEAARAPSVERAPDPTGASQGTAEPAPLPPVFILVVPLFHVTGCVPVMLGCFAAGLKLVMMYRWDPEKALALIESERVTQFVGVPTQSWDMLECPAFDRYDTSSLARVGGGGAPAPPKLVRRVEDSFRRGGPTIGYGMTETNAYGPQNSGPDYLTHPTSTGRATPIVALEVRDPDGMALPPGALGEIWMGGPHLFRGYWNRPDATAEVMVDGWLATGDLGHLDTDGFLYITDRAKDMVLRGGENVYCAEVEAAIYEHPGVYEAAVYGVPHDRLGEEVAATVMVKPGAELDEVALHEYLAAHLAPYKIPTRVRLVTEELPRNASGKILKRNLRDLAMGR